MNEKYNQLTKKELILRLEATDGLIEQIQKETNEEELLSFPWAGNLGQWNWMVPNNKLVFNEKKATNLGYSRKEIPDDIGFEFFTSKLHPDDYDQVMDNMYQHLIGNSNAYEVEYRIEKKDGTYAWYYDRGTVTKRCKDNEPLVVAGIVFDISKNKKIEQDLYHANQRLRYLSRTDDLTSTLNKRYMTQKISGEMKALDGKNRWISLMMIDIDNFKEVNDRLGHLAGDKLLENVAHTIQTNLSSEDSLARWGGDEFLIMLKNQNTDEVQKKAYLIQEELKALDSQFEKVTLSIGFAHIYKPAQTEKAIDLVDKLMYIAKTSGKNKVVF